MAKEPFVTVKTVYLRLQYPCQVTYTDWVRFWFALLILSAGRRKKFILRTRKASQSIMDYEGKFALAEKNVQAKMGFYKHLTSFCVGNGVLAGVDLFTTPGFIWFHWPLLVWTLILGVHGKKAAGKKEKQ